MSTERRGTASLLVPTWTAAARPELACYRHMTWRLYVYSKIVSRVKAFRYLCQAIDSIVVKIAHSVCKITNMRCYTPLFQQPQSPHLHFLIYFGNSETSKNITNIHVHTHTHPVKTCQCKDNHEQRSTYWRCANALDSLSSVTRSETDGVNRTRDVLKLEGTVGWTGTYSQQTLTPDVH